MTYVRKINDEWMWFVGDEIVCVCVLRGGVELVVVMARREGEREGGGGGGGGHGI